MLLYKLSPYFISPYCISLILFSMDLQKSVSETINDNMLAEIRRRVDDPDFVPDIKLPPYLFASLCFVFHIN